MAFIPFLNAAQVEPKWLVGSQVCEMVFTARRASLPSAGDLTALNTIVRNWIDGSYKNLMSNQASLFQITSFGLSSDTEPVAVTTISPNITGTVAVAALPNNSTIVTSLRTNKRGRSYRGRKYNPGLPANVQATPVQITVPAATAVIASFTNLYVALNSGGWDFVVPSKRQNKNDLLVGVMTQVTQFAMDLALDSIRRRLQGRGL